MKKVTLFKALSVMFALFVLLSWVIPASSFTEAGLALGQIQPLGFFDLIRVPLNVLVNYAPYGMFFLVLGGLYGVINKTGVYGNAISFFVKGFKKNEIVALISVVLIFGLLSAFTGLSLVLFILVPFFITILLKMKFTKLTAILATVGAIIVGNFSSVYGFNISGYINHYFALDVNDNIIIKLLLFVASFTLLILFLIKETKKQKSEKISDLALFDEKSTSKKSFIPLIIVLDVTILFLLVAGFNWGHAFNVTVFEELHVAMLEFKIGDALIFDWLVGSVDPIGWWNVNDFTMVMVVMAIVIGWLYNIKLKDTFESFVEGAKEMVVPAIYAMIAHIIMGAIAINAGNQADVFNTITNSILSINDGFSYIAAMLLPFASSILQNDLTNIIYTSSSQIKEVVTDVATYPIFGMALQTIHSAMMLILPTSVLLVVALTYLKVSYVQWLEYIWKLVVALLVLSLLTTALMTILI